MSYKTTLKTTLERLAQDYEKEVKATEMIYHDPELTEAGINTRVKANQARFLERWTPIMQDIQTMAESIIKAETAKEEKALAEKVGNAEYSSLLASTLAILPHVEGVDKTVLKQRLSVFKGDPLAIEAIKQALPGKGLEWAFVLPTDKRGERQRTVTEITATTLKHIHAIEADLGQREHKKISIPAGIESTLSYISGLNDDCTEYAEAADE